MTGLGSIFVRMAASLQTDAVQEDGKRYNQSNYVFQHCPDCNCMVAFARRVGFYECTQCQRRIYSVAAPTAADEG